ncbi:MAG: tyrosine-type recombinase/integrase [Desulfurobacteriaceae bacterium]
MRLFKRNGVWYVEIERNIRRSLRTKSRDEAYRLFKRLQREYLKGNIERFVKKKEEKIKISRFIKEYLDWCEYARSKWTYKKAKFVLGRFSKVVGDLYLSQLKRKHLDTYVSFMLKNGYSKVTINIHIRTIKSAFSKAVEWEYLSESPFKGYKQLKQQERPPSFLLPEDIKRVEEVISSPEWLIIFRIFVYTGMRLSEVSNLDWKDIDFEMDIITVRKSKNYKSRNIPLHPILKKELLKWRKESGKVVRFNYHTITHKIKEFLVKAGFPHLRLHDLRHTFASLLVMNGVDLRTVQILLGHQDYKTTEVYAHLSQRHLKEAIKKLPVFG